MFYFGRRSRKNLDTCHPLLIQLAEETLKFSPYDFSIIEGHRPVARQRELFYDGMTLIDGVTEIGKHNKIPSEAFDFVPYPGKMHGVSVWDEPVRFAMIAGMFLITANRLEIPIRSGIDWNMDSSSKDHTLFDAPHIELML